MANKRQNTQWNNHCQVYHYRCILLVALKQHKPDAIILILLPSMHLRSEFEMHLTIKPTTIILLADMDRH